ncbi:MAG: hypothetical protein QXP04_03925 [Candidatus Nanoarchaeia archaeon]|nr:hypothetical protein [Candidatus Jingweiarchaeum tengchongense]
MKLDKHDIKMLKFMANMLDAIISYPDLDKSSSNKIEKLKKNLNLYLEKPNKEIDVKILIELLLDYNKELKKLMNKCEV